MWLTYLTKELSNYMDLQQIDRDNIFVSHFSDRIVQIDTQDTFKIVEIDTKDTLLKYNTVYHSNLMIKLKWSISYYDVFSGRIRKIWPKWLSWTEINTLIPELRKKCLLFKFYMMATPHYF